MKGKIYDKLVTEFDEIGKLMHRNDLATRNDYERFEKLTWYQNGIRFALDLMEAEAIDDFEHAIAESKEELI